MCPVILHTKDLGTTCHILANIFWESVVSKSWGASTQDANVALLWEDMKRYYKRVKVSSKFRGELRKQHIRPDGQYPKMRRINAAAASCEDTTPLTIASELTVQADPAHAVPVLYGQSQSSDSGRVWFVSAPMPDTLLRMHWKLQ